MLKLSSFAHLFTIAHDPKILIKQLVDIFLSFFLSYFLLFTTNGHWTFKTQVRPQKTYLTISQSMQSYMDMRINSWTLERKNKYIYIFKKKFTNQIEGVECYQFIAEHCSCIYICDLHPYNMHQADE